LYEFLGILFGCCIRTGVRFNLDLPPLVWKALVQDTLHRNDLDAIDHATCESLRYMSTIDTEKEFNAIIDETFTTQLSDKTMIELKTDGQRTKVTFLNRHEYVRLVIAARLNESRTQIEAIRRGIATILPIQLLNLLNWQDLELLVCGKAVIDIDLLRRHTQYSESIAPDAPWIESFWDVLSQFDQAQRRLFLRFVWAQERLPSDDAEFVRSRTRLLIKPSHYPNPDKALPRSDTCFANLELPAYSTEEIMRQRLLYAISTAVTMDADHNVSGLHEIGAPLPLSIGRRHGHF